MLRLEAIVLPHLDGKEVVNILLGFSTRDVLSEECFGYILKVMERVWRKRI